MPRMTKAERAAQERRQARNARRQERRRGYVTANRIPLSIEYSLGYKHDFQDHRGARAYVLRHQISEEDYQAAIAQDPNVEIDYVRAANNPELIYGKDLFQIQ